VTFADSLKLATGGDYTITAGNVTHSGQGIVCNGDVSFNSTGTSNWGNFINLTGASSALRVASGVGTVTATSCAVLCNGATSVIDADKATTIKTLSTGASGGASLTGSATLTVATDGTTFPLASGSTLPASFAIGTTAITLQSATLNVPADLTFGTQTVTAGTSVVNFTGTAAAIYTTARKSLAKANVNKTSTGGVSTVGASLFSHLTITDGYFYAGDTVYISDTMQIDAVDSVYAPVIRLTTSRAKLKITSTLAKNGIAKIVVDSCGATVVNNAVYKTPIYYPRVGMFTLSPASQTCTTGVAITSMLIVNSGCPADSFNAPTLPSGLVIATASGTITGTPLIPTATTTGYVYGYNSEGTKKDSTLWTFIIISLKKANRRAGLSTSHGLIIGTD
jgi:hypothetical protein